MIILLLKAKGLTLMYIAARLIPDTRKILIFTQKVRENTGNFMSGEG